jgi:hypothetical protein
MPRKALSVTGANGERARVEVVADYRLALEVFDRNMRRRDLLYRKHHRTLNGQPARKGIKHNGKRLVPLVGFLNVENEAAFRALVPRAEGSPWEGPRYTFSHLIGEGQTWHGPGSQWRATEDGHFVCAGCGGERLAAHQYCLMCDRHGRETRCRRRPTTDRRST